jgi:putative FmdB family regulatory protein
MPTYDYACLACGHELVIEHSITAPAKKKCPRCGKSKLERRIGAGASFVFKGSGFYSTDYRTKTPAPEAPAVANEATKAASDAADPKAPAPAQSDAEKTAPKTGAEKPAADKTAPAKDAPAAASKAPESKPPQKRRGDRAS